MNRKEPATELLLEVYAGAKMGAEFTADVMEKSQDTRFSQDLSTQINEYRHIESGARGALLRRGHTPEDYHVLQKLGPWVNLQTKTMGHPPTEALAALLMEGSKMGIVKMENGLGTTQDPEATGLARDMLVMEQDHIARLREYAGARQTQ